MVISKKSDQMIYHEEDCPYAKRISKKYCRHISIDTAKERGYHACSYCGGLHGMYLRMRDDPMFFGRIKEGISVSYDRVDRGLCFRTKNGFWKVLIRGPVETYKLWHLNHGHFDPELPDKILMRRTFHRQTDVKETMNMGRIIRYISDHDKAKRIIDNDWKKLPKSTPKQKKYYKQAKKRAKRKENKRIDELFKKLEKGEL